MKLFPMEDLNAMIAAGWGDTPRDKIPADWRTTPPTRHNQYYQGVVLSTKPANVQRRSASFQKRLAKAAKEREAYRAVAINKRTQRKAALDAHAGEMRSNSRRQGKAREFMHLTDQQTSA